MSFFFIFAQNIDCGYTLDPEARWPSGRASDSGREVGGSILTQVILEQYTFTYQTVLVTPRKRWLRPDMTEKLLTGTKSLNPNKQTNTLEPPQ